VSTATVDVTALASRRDKHRRRRFCRIDNFQRTAQMLLVENIALDYFNSGESSIEASSVASKATNGMAGLE
jgi:hypothetical protein